MKKTLLLCLGIFLIPIISYAQEQDAWVFFTDKENVDASISNPISILTQRAIDRKTNDGIAIDERDVPVNEVYITQIKQQTGITVFAKSKWFNALHVRGTESDITALESLPFVNNIDFADKSLNTSSRAQAIQDKFQIEDTSVVFNYGNTQNQVEMINADDLHLADYTGEGVFVAVMDSGFSNVDTMDGFQRLRSNGDLLGGYDFVDKTSDVYAFNGNDHGTKVLSDMAGFVQDEFVGTAPDASYYLFRTEDIFSENPLEESYWVEAAERADSLGVDLINTSLGYRVFDNPAYDYTPEQMDGETAFITRGASIAAEKGIVVVISAGNAGATAWLTVGAPADAANVLSIGAVDADEVYASFSSQGSIAQPTQKPDIVARGRDTYVIADNDAIVQNNGTSFSAPIMTGGIASLMQALPDATPMQIKQFVIESGSQFSNPDNLLGHGIPDLQLALDIGLSVLEQELQDFELYPNPVESNLTVRFPFGIEAAELRLFDVLGKQVLSLPITNSTNRINTSAFASGIYLLQIKSATISKTIKLIKS
ncbi:S8 family serine peptidase [Ichthyenterobacterium sp. W332]|uniref:S8 family serine peptidase n=1 Tax=Microcosmobacter mediterraneus TaxID=3075607 RepID=A0ABU2YH49_9FLAO|nr:S8 family serine peptidase [Ichthyenterobacterium sp. W332]MDT0557132.1 S8 family serine peptidase [Ichthyenterobacterium sp. W332]